MFYRGQRIKILSSSAKGHQHPAAGDKGYLSNVHIFLPYRLLLVNAFMTRYNDEPMGTRCERKRFFIDLGATPWTRDCVLKDPMDTINHFNTHHRLRVDLTSVFRRFNSVRVEDYPFMYSTHGIFPVSDASTTLDTILARKPQKKDQASKQSIPLSLCTAEFINDRGSLLSNTNEMKAWFNAVRAVIYYTLFYFGKNGDDGNPVKNHSVNYNIKSLWSSVISCLKFDVNPLDPSFGEQTKFYLADSFFELNDKGKTNFIYAVRKLMSMALLISDRHDQYLMDLAAVHISNATKKMLVAWSRDGLAATLDRYSGVSETIIINQIVRAIIVSPSADEVRNRLERMHHLGLLPTSAHDLSPQHIEKTIEIVKEVRNGNSLASLNRLLSSPFLQL